MSFQIRSMDILCSISGKPMQNAVLASDNYYYEKEILIVYLAHNNNTSPITNETIDGYYSHKIKPKNQHKHNIQIISDSMRQYKYEKLLNYKKFDFSLLDSNTLMESFATYCRDKTIIDHVIDNTINLECKDHLGVRLIHYALKSANEYLVKVLVSKNVDIESPEAYSGWAPIHAACYYSTPLLIRYMVQQNVNLNCKTTKFHSELINYTPYDLVTKSLVLSSKEKYDMQQFILSIINMKSNADC